jgi:diaminohydroxyphosphoribosylaminopyrimidine deaminase/5-amino-6-(5-phosphoribosylamino)uracil reductase
MAGDGWDEAGTGRAGPADAGGADRAPGRPGADHGWLRAAVELSRRCPPSESAFSVGAILVSPAGDVIATGFSRERDPHDHAEEAALAKAGEAALAKAGEAALAGATLYSSLEPCAARASRPVPCADLVIAAGLRRVVIAWLEPPVFVAGGGAGRLRAAGVTVIEIPGLAAAARAVNAHLLPPAAS